MQLNLSRLAPALAILLLVNLTCTKHPVQQSATNQEMISAARHYFIDSVAFAGHAVNYRASLTRELLWDQAWVTQSPQGAGVVVPITYAAPILMKANFTGPEFFHIDYLTRLWIYKDSNLTFQCRVLTSFPDSNYFKDPTQPFTGVRFVEDWYGHPLKKLLFTPDGKVKRFIPTNKQPDDLEVIETCYTLSGYNYSADDPEDGYYWTETVGCSVDEIDADGSGGGGGAGSPGGGGGPSAGGSSSSSHLPAVLPGTSVIKNITTYFQCFTNVGGSDHTYAVTVCVDQPDPGTRIPWTTSGDGSSGSSGGDNPIVSGHAFLMLSETYGNTTITRNIGFYPATDVNPLDVTSQGSLNDDELHTYNVSGSFSVTNAQFYNILNFVSQGNTPGYLYNLNTNNCTTFVINAVAQAGINLPRTIGTWPDGAGNDPGDLGEDLLQGNIPGMTLNSTGTNAAHPNVGQCN